MHKDIIRFIFMLGSFKLKEDITKTQETIMAEEKKQLKEKGTQKQSKKNTNKRNTKQQEIAKSEVLDEKIEVPVKDELEEIKEENGEKADVTILEKNSDTIQEKQQEEEKIQENKSTDGLHRYTKLIAIVSVILIIAAMVFSTIFALLNKTNDKIVKGVFVKGIDISGLTKQEATDKLSEMFSKELKEDITLKHADFETVVTPEQIEMNFKLSEAIDLAYSIGRTGKILKDNYDIVNASLSKIEINPAYSYNDEVLTNFIISTQGNLPDILKQSSYWIDGDNLVIDKGNKGVAINVDSLKKQIIETSVKFRTRKYSN